MKSLKFTYLLIVAIIPCDVALATGDGAPDRLKSPDGKFTAEVAPGSDEPNSESGVVITNNQTGKKYPLLEVDPLYPMKWTGDSTTLITISHIARGTRVITYHFNGKKWDARSAVPDMGDGYEVVGEVVGKYTVELTYDTFDVQSEHQNYQDYLCSFVFHPDTGVRTGVKIKKIDLDVFERLKHKWEMQNK